MHETRNLCNTWKLNNRRKLEACVLYDEGGKPTTARYTVYNGWGLPAHANYDNGLDGIDKKIKYTYDQRHKLRGMRISGESGIEEIIYDEEGKIVLIIIDK